MLKLKPQESFVVIFHDKTSENRSKSYIEEMITNICNTANNFGYDIQTYGSYDNMIKFFRSQQTMDEIISEPYMDDTT